jgi:hypothetical protein
MATEEEIARLKQKHAGDLLRRAGVSGVGVESGDSGPVLTVYLTDAADQANLPSELEGHTVRYVVTGAFRKQQP